SYIGTGKRKAERSGQMYPFIGYIALGRDGRTTARGYRALIHPHRGIGSEEQPLELRTRVIGTHEGLTDQETVDAVVQHQLHIIPAENAAFRDGQAVRRDLWQQFQGGVEGYRK